MYYNQANSQSQTSIPAIVESQYNTSASLRAQYWRPSFKLVKKLRFFHEATVSLCSVLLLRQIALPTQSYMGLQKFTLTFSIPDIALLEN